MFTNTAGVINRWLTRYVNSDLKSDNFAFFSGIMYVQRGLGWPVYLAYLVYHYNYTRQGFIRLRIGNARISK